MFPFLLATTLIAQIGAAPSCSSTAVAIASASVARTVQLGAMNHYELRVTVTNNGAPQAGNVLQDVAIYRDGSKADQKGVPPLGAGQSYSFTYGYDRNADAGTGSSTFTFVLDEQTPGGPCRAGSSYSLPV